MNEQKKHFLLTLGDLSSIVLTHLTKCIRESSGDFPIAEAEYCRSADQKLGKTTKNLGKTKRYLGILCQPIKFPKNPTVTNQNRGNITHVPWWVKVTVLL